MFSVVFDVVASPKMQRHPSQNAEDMGAKLNEPSSFSELIKTTGVPKYKIGGSPSTCSLLFPIGVSR
jgi:hypothetical protein